MSESLLLHEIAEQPDRLRQLLADGAGEVDAIARALASKSIRHVVIAARGSSDNAARYAQYVFGAFNRVTVTLATPSLFTRYNAPPRMDGALVVGISQSGQSPDLVAVVEEGRRQGCPTLAITNAAGSPLTRGGRPHAATPSWSRAEHRRDEDLHGAAHGTGDAVGGCGGRCAAAGRTPVGAGSRRGGARR